MAARGAAATRGRKRLLIELARSGNLFLACAAASMTRRQVSALRRSDEAFAVAYEEAMDEAADRLEAEAWRRAFEGVAEPVVRGGRQLTDQTGKPLVVQRYSDPLMAMLLRSKRPDRYRAGPVAAMAANDPAALMKEIAADEDPPRTGC